MDDGDSGAAHRRQLQQIAGEQLGRDGTASQVAGTTLHTLRAIVRVLHSQMGYLSQDNAQTIERLVDKNDVSVGAAYEVYLLTDDLEDLTHSLLTVVKRQPGGESKADFGYREKELARMQAIVKKLPSGCDKDRLYVSLNRCRSIIDKYQDLVSTTENETPENMQLLVDSLNDVMNAERVKQQSLAASLRDIRPFDRKRSFKEIHDEMQVIMMEHKNELLVQDPEIFKSVACGEESSKLTALYEEVQKQNENAKIVTLLNQLIESYFVRNTEK